MGGGQSKEEQLYQAVQHANHTAVKTLRRDGTSLEWTDKDGRTPLILACTRSELFDMVITLLNLGASIKAFRPGSHGGFPLHHAAKRGLDKTVILLLSRGADPLALNDDGQTPLDMARNRGHVSVVRIIEDRMCLFSGVLREISGPGFLEALAPQWVTRKVWAVVMPSAQSRRIPRHELVIYQSPKASLPRIIIALSKVQFDEPNFNLADPVMILTDRTSKTRFKFLSEFESRRAQLEKFFRACKGISAQQSTSSSPQESVSPTRSRCPPVTISASGPPRVVTAPPPQQVVMCPPPRLNKISSSSPPNDKAEIPEDVALAMAINASIQSANAEGLVLSPTSSSECWPSLSSPPKQARRRAPLSRNRWSLDSDNSNNSNSNSSCWGSPEAGPSSATSLPLPSPPPYEQQRRQQPPPLPQYCRTRVDNIWQTRPVAKNPPVRNVLVKDPSAPAAPQDIPVEILIPPGPAPSPWQEPAPVPSPRQQSPPKEPQTRDAATSGSASGSGFSLFGLKKKAEDKAVANRVAPAAQTAPTGEEKASGQCVVCWDAPARGVCIPCGHLAGCMNCLMEIKDKTWGCPVCRTSIQQVVKVFTV